MSDDAYRAFAKDGVDAVLAAADRRGGVGRRSPRRCSSSTRRSTTSEGLAPLGARLDIVEHERRPDRRSDLLPGACRRRCSCRPSSSCAQARFVAPRATRAVRARHRREADRPRPGERRARSTTRSPRCSTSGRSTASITTSGKETVQNILVLRFANSIFEPLFNQKYIDHVQITVAEEEGVGTRAGYYEQAGALRDMVQNHLLQLLALVAMEPPHSLDADVVRDEKLEILQSLRPMRRRRASTRSVVRGAVRTASRYRLREEPASTRTRAPRRSSRCRCSSTTGAGPACRSSCAPASGCRSAPARSPIQLKDVPPILFNADPAQRLEPNVLSIRIQPDEGFSLASARKRPGPQRATSSR